MEYLDYGNSSYSTYIEPTPSITGGKMITTPENLRNVLKHEFNDVSKDLGNRLSSTIGRIGKRSKGYNEIILIKKRIQNHGNKRIVRLNVSEKLVPKYDEYLFTREDEKDFTMRAILVIVLFLLGGIIFTTMLKFFPKYIKEKYISEVKIMGKENKS